MAGGLSVKARWMLALGACAAGAGAFVMQARQRPNAVAPSASALSAAPVPSESAAPPFRRAPPGPPPRWPFEDPSAAPRVVPFQSPEAQDEERIRNLPPEERRAERSKRASQSTGKRPRYPADCRPASEARSRLLPQGTAPVVRPLAPAPVELGRALLRATQDRAHLLPEESAILTIEVAVDDRRTPFEVKSADLSQPNTTPGVPTESLAAVAFRDDGVAPDKTAKDGITTARVSVPQQFRNLDGELRVRAEVSTASETGEVMFPLLVTSTAPAGFTGTVREAVENGSLAFYAGIRVKRPGRYDFIGRVYDSEHRVMAVLTSNATLDSSAREIRLAFCGALLRDEAVPGPWELRDVEGFHFVESKDRVDRIPLKPWSGPYRTRQYPLETFSEGSAEKTEPSAP
jgi:hypothetical protein